MRTWLGRTSPPVVSAGQDEEAGIPQEDPEGAGDAQGPAGSGGAARARGRFTRNFVVQGSAADWALAAPGRAAPDALRGPRAQLVFFQHDEVIVHCPAEESASVPVPTMSRPRRTESSPRSRPAPSWSGSSSWTTSTAI
ncbi:hypothetical protein SBADM41S_03339 [Streptomyces badius]